MATEDRASKACVPKLSVKLAWGSITTVGSASRQAEPVGLTSLGGCRVLVREEAILSEGNWAEALITPLQGPSFQPVACLSRPKTSKFPSRVPFGMLGEFTCNWLPTLPNRKRVDFALRPATSAR